MADERKQDTRQPQEQARELYQMAQMPANKFAALQAS